LFIDEVGFSLSRLTGRGRAVAGTQPTLIVSPQGKRLNCIAALSTSGIEHVKYIYSSQSRYNNGKKGVDAEDYQTFLLALGANLNENGIQNCLFVMDNAKIHHAKMHESSTWQLLKRNYGIDRMYLPPYSPFLNPIELVFHTIKANLARQDLDRNSLKNKAEKEFANVTAEHAEKYFQHCKKFYPLCANREMYTGTILQVPQ